MNGSSKVLSSVLLSGVLLVAGLTNPVEVNSKQTTAAGNHNNITMVSASKVVNYKTVIDGKSVSLTQTSVKKGSNYLVPANAVLKKLGASTTYNSKTKILTIKKGSKTSTIKLGSKVATVAGKKVTLSTTAQTINKTVMMPYNLVSKATGAKVSVSTSSKTIKITKPSSVSSSRIKTKYQGHTYGADNQYQYDKTMAYVDKYFKSYKNDFNFGGDYSKSFIDYFKNGV